MDLQEPARSSPTSRFGGEIDIGIEKELRSSSIHGNVHSHLDPRRLRANARCLVCEKPSKLPNHVGPPTHVNDLLQVEIFSRLDPDLTTGLWIGDVGYCPREVVFEHHLPAEAMLHVSP